MNAAEICPLTESSVARIMAVQIAEEPYSNSTEKRRTLRWPFPGMAELWIPDEEGGERYILATSVNLSMRGIGIRCDEPLPVGLELELAFHEPELSLHGRAVVRHCTEIETDHLIGLEFVYND